ncbi:hypothetical protein Msip34_1637 [Methylovorus glucosotrophus SIP3-4]|uniref:Uncharacterized protein n=1 Tax=Methylovorus glucosotrophus (strain SIP3-4) TaxID=582744 RepID=C6XEA7_METGS|nr:hypothetical protein Msip34_1637 [Methylovorus glucosotrophus SIP3-4]
MFGYLNKLQVEINFGNNIFNNKIGCFSDCFSRFKYFLFVFRKWSCVRKDKTFHVQNKRSFSFYISKGLYDTKIELRHINFLKRIYLICKGSQNKVVGGYIFFSTCFLKSIQITFEIDQKNNYQLYVVLGCSPFRSTRNPACIYDGSHTHNSLKPRSAALDVALLFPNPAKPVHEALQ